MAKKKGKPKKRRPKVPESLRRKRERWDRADAENDREYWWSLSPHERLEAAEYLRAKKYGYLDDESRRPRLVKVFRTVSMAEQDD